VNDRKITSLAAEPRRLCRFEVLSFSLAALSSGFAGVIVHQALPQFEIESIVLPIYSLLSSSILLFVTWLTRKESVDTRLFAIFHFAVFVILFGITTRNSFSSPNYSPDIHIKNLGYYFAIVAIVAGFTFLVARGLKRSLIERFPSDSEKRK
jgi:hypothetical protein